MLHQGSIHYPVGTKPVSGLDRGTPHVIFRHSMQYDSLTSVVDFVHTKKL